MFRSQPRMVRTIIRVTATMISMTFVGFIFAEKYADGSLLIVFAAAFAGALIGFGFAMGKN